MTRLYAGWAPGDALAFGYSLGLTASHSDILDYRAMLARFRVGGLPAANVRYELLNDEPLRALDERYRSAIGRHVCQQSPPTQERSPGPLREEV